MNVRGIFLVLFGAVVLAAALRAQSAEDYLDAANVKLDKKDTVGALADLDRAIALKPDYRQAYQLRSELRRDKDLPGAISDLDHVIAAYSAGANEPKPDGITTSSPSSADTTRANLYMTRAAMKRLSDDLDGALADYDRAIAIYPANGYNYSTRGMARQEKGNLIGAIADYSTYKELTGDQAGTRAPVVQVGPSGIRTPVARPANPIHLYLYFALCRLETGPAVQELKLLVPEWRDGFTKTAGLYLTGGATEEEMLAKASEGDAEMVSRQQCQAYYYVGMRRLIVRKPDEAKLLFERCLATGQKLLTEYRFARSELARLSGPAEAVLKAN